MRWLITGAAGMVGTDIHRELRDQDEDTVAVGRAELDVSDEKAVHYLVEHAAPTVIVNCAAYTKVDDCETDEERATAVNGLAAGFLADAADRSGALLVHISTDFVFDGSSTTPYEPGDPVAPLSAYGRSKLVGEREAARAAKHLIVRTSWLFGTSGWNFVEAIRKQVDNGRTELKVVNDQRGRPTYTPHLARAILRMARIAHTDPSARGIAHYADEPECTWFDFAAAIVRAMGKEREVTVHPVTSAEFVRPAVRPAYSVLSTDRYERITGVAPESWEEGLAEYMALRAG